MEPVSVEGGLPLIQRDLVSNHHDKAGISILLNPKMIAITCSFICLRFGRSFYRFLTAVFGTVGVTVVALDLVFSKHGHETEVRKIGFEVVQDLCVVYSKRYPLSLRKKVENQHSSSLLLKF